MRIFIFLLLRCSWVLWTRFLKRFCVGLLNALYTYKGLNVSKNKLAEEAATTEIDVLKRLIGKQDHCSRDLHKFFKFHSDEKFR